MIRPDDDLEPLARALRQAPPPPPGALALALDQALAAYDALPPVQPVPPVPPQRPSRLSRLWQALQRPGGMAGAALVAGLAVVAIGPALRDPPPGPAPLSAPPTETALPDTALPQAAPPVQALRKAAPMAPDAAPEAAADMAPDMAQDLAEAQSRAPWQALARALDAYIAPESGAEPGPVNAADLALAQIIPPPTATVLLPSPFAATPVFALAPPGLAPALPPAATGQTGWTLHPQATGQPDPRPMARFAGAAAGVALALQAEGFPLPEALAFAEATARPEDAANLALLRRWAATQGK